MHLTRKRSLLLVVADLVLACVVVSAALLAAPVRHGQRVATAATADVRAA